MEKHDMEYVDILKKAKELLSDPLKWNQDGYYCKDRDPSTGCFCIFGAMSHVSGTYEGSIERRHNELNLDHSDEVTTFNDSCDTTHEDLMGWFDKTIKAVSNE